MYRSTGDIFDNFESFTGIAKSQASKLGTSAPGCFNDMDMLTVGMYGKGNVGTSGCNDTDYKTQFALWCMFGVPLMLGCDIRNMTPETKKLVTNKELIRIDQDPEARGVIELKSHWGHDYAKIYFRHLADGEYALGFFNLGENKASMPMFISEAGIPSTSGYALALTDVFTGEELDPVRDSLTLSVEAHDCRVFRCKVVKA